VHEGRAAAGAHGHAAWDGGQCGWRWGADGWEWDWWTGGDGPCCEYGAGNAEGGIGVVVKGWLEVSMFYVFAKKGMSEGVFVEGNGDCEPGKSLGYDTHFDCFFSHGG